MTYIVFNLLAKVTGPRLFILSPHIEGKILLNLAP